MPEKRSLPFGGEILPFDGSAILTPNFLDEATADILFEELLISTKWEDTELIMFGKKVREPRQSTWHADPHLAYTYSGSQRRPQPWTHTLANIRALCESHIGTTFNGVLLNHYRNGNDYMGWHADNERCNGPEPIIASLSLGAERRFDLRHRETHDVATTSLAHGSLLVMSGLSQQKWVHRLPKSARVEEARINITFRFIDLSL